MLWLKTTVVISSTFYFENIQNKVEREVQTPPHLALPIVNILLHSLIYPFSVSSYRAPSSEPFESYRCDTRPLNISTLYPKNKDVLAYDHNTTLLSKKYNIDAMLFRIQLIFKFLCHDDTHCKFFSF